jgi:hypothetical protein
VGKVRIQFQVICVLIGLSLNALAQDGSYKKSQFYRGVTYQHSVTQVTEADVNGDGSKEVVVCYREPGDAVNQPGGVLILSEAATGWVVAWHALFENVYPKSVTVNGAALTFDLVQTTMQDNKTVSKTLVRGKDFFFRDEESSPFHGVKISPTSTLRDDSIKPENLFDRDLKTAWAEGAEGTGVDETISFEFRKPVNLGLVGVLHGNYLGKRQWLDNNRLHRAEITVETSSDRYDTDSDIDFEADLGLGLYGDRVELSFSNKPVMRYFKLCKRNVLSVELKITSVLLGEKNDDTYIAEIDFAELIPASVIFGTGKKKTQKPKEPEATPERPAKDDDDWTEDDGF